MKGLEPLVQEEHPQPAEERGVINIAFIVRSALVASHIRIHTSPTIKKKTEEL